MNVAIAHVGRPPAPPSIDDYRDEVRALRVERAADARRMSNVVPMIRFVRASAEDMAAERAAGIVQLEVERIARRNPRGAA